MFRNLLLVTLFVFSAGAFASEYAAVKVQRDVDSTLCEVVALPEEPVNVAAQSPVCAPPARFWAYETRTPLFYMSNPNATPVAAATQIAEIISDEERAAVVNVSFEQTIPESEQVCVFAPSPRFWAYETSAPLFYMSNPNSTPAAQ